MLAFKIIIAIVLFIGLLGILVVIGAGELKTKEDTINDIEEEVKCLAEIEKQNNKRKWNEFLKKIVIFFNVEVLYEWKQYWRKRSLYNRQ